MPGFTLTGSTSVGRDLRSAALLADGRVLVAGGRDAQRLPLLTAEVYDSQSGRWKATEFLHQPHDCGVLVAVADGAASIGGDEPGQDTVLETWSLATEHWTTRTTSPPMPRAQGTWTRATTCWACAAAEHRSTARISAPSISALARSTSCHRRGAATPACVATLPPSPYVRTVHRWEDR